MDTTVSLCYRAFIFSRKHHHGKYLHGWVTVACTSKNWWHWIRRRWNFVSTRDYSNSLQSHFLIGGLEEAEPSRDSNEFRTSQYWIFFPSKFIKNLFYAKKIRDSLMQERISRSSMAVTPSMLGGHGKNVNTVWMFVGLWMTRTQRFSNVKYETFMSRWTHNNKSQLCISLLTQDINSRTSVSDCLWS